MIKADPDESESSFWSCSSCMVHNPMDSTVCQNCSLPGNVCLLMSQQLFDTTNHTTTKAKKKAMFKLSFAN